MCEVCACWFSCVTVGGVSVKMFTFASPQDRVMLGSDYPFPLGEVNMGPNYEFPQKEIHFPGKLIEEMDDFGDDLKV